MDNQEANNNKAEKTKKKNSPPGGRSSKRREQQRSVETRITLLKAALSEFAEKGYDGASMRTIAEKTDTHYTLITYHFRNKDALWKATAEHFFSQLKSFPFKSQDFDTSLAPIDNLRKTFFEFYKFSVNNPDFHRFMVRENQPGNQRVKWLLDNYLGEIVNATMEQIRRAQEDGDLPKCDPAFLYYMLVASTTALTSLSGEIQYITNTNVQDEPVVENYWRLIEQLIFKRHLYS